MIDGLEHMIKAVAALPDFGANMALEIASAIAVYAPTMATTSSVDGQDLTYIKCTLFDVRPDHRKKQKKKGGKVCNYITLWSKCVQDSVDVRKNHDGVARFETWSSKLCLPSDHGKNQKKKGG
ncbi:hypothetical protein CFC21_038924 [Triticum aestivum]|uniref:Uncharacterized protein n=2 Tax=Triticum aestivum TaxID=4565 RepID=A0A1D5VQF1_WHEAT|nr:hypothetical protein CFC21_038924 [Triticum aestivum]